jgi:precorrin-2 dehydrogenase/sirohydrochlorin ferrochelatase
MPIYYPIYLNLTEKRCVLFGGGTVAEGKLINLKEAGAHIVVISPEVTPGIRQASIRGELEWEVRTYRPGDLNGAFLVIAATNVSEVNRQIYQEADRLGVLLNVVDDSPLCNFIAPSIVKRGPVTLAISTGGVSPALARKMREILSADSVLEWADLANVLAQARFKVKKLGITIDPQRWQCSIDQELLQIAQGGREDEALVLLCSRLLDQSMPSLCSQLNRCESSGCIVRSREHAL